ncbi:MAG: SRPBCC family protein [bacterium]
MTVEMGNFENRVHSKDLVLKRSVRAPRDLVFEVFTQAEHLAKWWAPKPFTVPKCQVDLRPGGLWRYTFRAPDGREHDCEALYREVDPPSRLVMESSVPDPSGKPFFKIRQTVELETRGDETDLTLSVKVLQANPGSEPMLGGMEQGTNMTLDNLKEYLAGLKGTSKNSRLRLRRSSKTVSWPLAINRGRNFLFLCDLFPLPNFFTASKALKAKRSPCRDAFVPSST